MKISFNWLNYCIYIKYSFCSFISVAQPRHLVFLLVLCLSRTLRPYQPTWLLGCSFFALAHPCALFQTRTFITWPQNPSRPWFPQLEKWGQSMPLPISDDISLVLNPNLTRKYDIITSSFPYTLQSSPNTLSPAPSPFTEQYHTTGSSSTLL